MTKRSAIQMVTYLTILTISVLIGINGALANSVEISYPYHFRDIRGPNTVAFSIGDRLVFGASVELQKGRQLNHVKVLFAIL